MENDKLLLKYLAIVKSHLEIRSLADSAELLTTGDHDGRMWPLNTLVQKAELLH